MDAYERDRIASIVHTDCSLIPGANCYNAACFAIDAMEARSKRLNEAAPALLDALEYALPYLEACVPNPRNGVNADYSIDVNCVARAKAAIAKARGEA